jgi:hypothetical protein
MTDSAGNPFFMRGAAAEAAPCPDFRKEPSYGPNIFKNPKNKLVQSHNEKRKGTINLIPSH